MVKGFSGGRLAALQIVLDRIVVESLSHVQLFGTPCIIAHEASLSVGFPRQEHWSGLPFPSLGALPDPGIKPLSLASPALQADSLPLAPSGKYSLFGKST